MAETLSSLNLAKYDEHVENLANKRRRRAEVTENEMVKVLAQTVEWLLAAVEGNQTRQTTAISALATIYGETITPPTNSITTTLTEANTRGAIVDLTSGDNTITFASVFETGYLLFVNCYTEEGGQVYYTQDPDDRAASGFDINVVSACKCDYLAIKL